MALGAAAPIKLPTILLDGADDGLNLPEGAAAHAPHFTSRFEYRLIPGAGHSVPQETPSAFADALLSVHRWTLEQRSSLDAHALALPARHLSDTLLLEGQKIALPRFSPIGLLAPRFSASISEPCALEAQPMKIAAKTTKFLLIAATLGIGLAVSQTAKAETRGHGGGHAAGWHGGHARGSHGGGNWYRGPAMGLRLPGRPPV